MKTSERLYLDADGKIVTYGEREKAVELFKPKGGVVTPRELEQFKGQIEKYIPGLKTPKAKKEEPKEEPEKEPEKKKTPGSNKMKTPKSNKADTNG